MKDQSTDISAHEKDSTVTQKTADNVRLSAHDDQHQMSLCQRAVHVQLQEEDQRDREEEE